MEVQKKYKPGPWNLKESFLEDDDHRYRILTVTSDEGNVVATNELYSLTEPQARLIAAAPQMLEALRLIAHAEDGGAISVKPYGDMESGLRQKILDAIAFARRFEKESA